MHPALKTFGSFLRILQDLVDSVRGTVDINRPRRAPRAVARRLLAGIRLIEAYLRRVLIVLALELEHGLVDRPGQEKRAKSRRCFDPRPVFRVLVDRFMSAPDRDRIEDLHDELKRERRWRAPPAPVPVYMGRLYRRLQLLTAIADDPMQRARRLAWTIARRHPGWLPVPDPDLRVPGPVRRLWSTEAGLTFSALAHDIRIRSRSRPPPLAPLPPAASDGPRVRLLAPNRPWPDWLPDAAPHWS